MVKLLIAGFPSSVSGLRSPVSRLRSSVFPLPTSVFPLPSSYFGLPSSVFRLPTSFSRLPSPVSRLPSSVFPLPSSVFRLPSSSSLPYWLPGRYLRYRRYCSRVQLTVGQTDTRFHRRPRVTCQKVCPDFALTVADQGGRAG